MLIGGFFTLLDNIGNLLRIERANGSLEVRQDRDDLGVVAAAVNVSNVRFPNVQRARSAVAAPATADAAPAPASPVNIATATVASEANTGSGMRIWR